MYICPSIQCTCMCARTHTHTHTHTYMHQIPAAALLHYYSTLIVILIQKCNVCTPLQCTTDITVGSPAFRTRLSLLTFFRMPDTSSDEKSRIASLQRLREKKVARASREPAGGVRIEEGGDAESVSVRVRGR